MKNAAICLISSILGGCLVFWLQSGVGTLTVAAAQQDRFPRDLSTIARKTRPAETTVSYPSETPAETVAVDSLSELAPPRVYNAEGLAPDEAVSTYVYETNNRSVANIGTRIGAARGLFGENPTEDSGSGFILDQNGHILTNNQRNR